MGYGTGLLEACNIILNGRDAGHSLKSIIGFIQQKATEYANEAQRLRHKPVQPESSDKKA